MAGPVCRRGSGGPECADRAEPPPGGAYYQEGREQKGNFLEAGGQAIFQVSGRKMVRRCTAIGDRFQREADALPGLSFACRKFRRFPEPALLCFSAMQRTASPRAILHVVPFSMILPSFSLPNTQVIKRMPGRRYLETHRVYSLDAGYYGPLGHIQGQRRGGTENYIDFPDDLNTG